MKFDRFLHVLLATVLCAALLAAVGCETTPSGDASSTASAASDASSAVSAESDDGDLLPETDERGYILVNNARKNRDLTMSSDDMSALFDRGAPGFVIENGPYLVDLDTLKFLSTAKVEGAGSVKYINYRTLHSTSQSDPFDGAVPVSKLNDPVWLCACYPSEATTFMTTRVNAENMYSPAEKHNMILPIGGIYRNEDNVPADDASVTICIKDIRLLLHTKEKGWFYANDIGVPSSSMVNNVYNLPWLAENGSWHIPSSQIKKVDDHIELSMTGADFAGKYKETRPKVEASLIHFWGENVAFEDFGVKATDVDGVVAAYTAWIKEADMVGHFVGTIGADLRERDRGSTDQVFSGYNYLLTTTPRVIYCHNVGPKAYDSVMDSAKVQEMLGLK